MTIVFITTNLNVGGAERQLYYLARELQASSRYRIHVVTLAPGDAMRRQFEDAGVIVKSIHKHWKLDATVVLRLARYLRRVRPDIVHCQLYAANIWGRAAAVLAGCPNIIVSERNSNYLWKTKTHFAVERMLKRFARIHLGNSRRVCEYSESNLGLPAGACRLMYNGVDITEFTPRQVTETPELTVGTVANLEPKKDLETFLRMAALIHAQLPRVRFRIVGEGKLRDSLAALANELGIAGQVAFVGRSMDVKSEYQRFDVFVLTSRHEGFANVIVEAMASSVPVAATDVGGAPDCIEEGRNGYLVPVGQPQIVADRVLNLLDNRPLRLAMGSAGRDRAVNDFSLPAMVRRYEDLYQELVDDRTVRAASAPA